MSNYPTIAIHSCSEDVDNVEFVDITFNLKGCTNIVSVTAVSAAAKCCAIAVIRSVINLRLLASHLKTLSCGKCRDT